MSTVTHTNQDDDNTMKFKPDQLNKEALPKYAYNRNKSKEPKRNTSAFVFFSNHMRAKLKAENKYNPNPNEMMIRLAELWRELPKEEKKPYEDQAHNDKLRYYQELEVFWKDNPQKPLQNKTKKNHIKKPGSAYGLFLRDVKDGVKAQNPGLKMADILRIISQQWKSLEQGKKAIYQERARRENEETRKRLSEHQSKNADEEEDLSKKTAQKHQLIRRKLLHEGLSVSPNDTENSQETNVQMLTIKSEINCDYGDKSLFMDENLMFDIPACPDFGSPSDFLDFTFGLDSDANAVDQRHDY